jgi:hypothetical protein
MIELPQFFDGECGTYGDYRCYACKPDLLRMEVRPMTIEEAAMVIFEEASRQGEPLTMDVCRQIAQRLLIPRYMTNMIEKPGEIAQKHRDRYEENAHDKQD